MRHNSGLQGFRDTLPMLRRAHADNSELPLRSRCPSRPTHGAHRLAKHAELRTKENEKTDKEAAEYRLRLGSAHAHGIQRGRVQAGRSVV